MPIIEANIDLIGDKKLARKLEKLSASSARKIMRPAISAGLTPINKKAKQLAKSKFGSNTISKMIGKKVKTEGSGILGKVVVREKPERTVTVEGREVPFEVVANILEFGRKDGSLPARSYMRAAKEIEGDRALKIVTKKAWKNLEKLF